MFFSLSEAALKVGMSRSSIYRLIDEGKLSATIDRRGKKVVELTELLRVFGSIQENTGQEDTQEHNKHNPVRHTEHTGRTGQDTLFSTVQELEKLRYQLQLKDMELKLKDKELAFVAERMNDLKQASEQVNQEKNKLLEIIERQSLMLAAPKPKQATSTARSKTNTATPRATPAKTLKALKTTSKQAGKPASVKAVTASQKKSPQSTKMTKAIQTAKPAAKKPSLKAPASKKVVATKRR